MYRHIYICIYIYAYIYIHIYRDERIFTNKSTGVGAGWTAVVICDEYGTALPPATPTVVTCCSHVCDMPLWDMCVMDHAPWLIHTGLTYVYGSALPLSTLWVVICRLHLCDMSRGHVCYESRVRLIHMCDSCTWNGVPSRNTPRVVTWRLHLCDKSYSHVCRESRGGDTYISVTHSYVWHDLYIRDITSSDVWHDSWIFANWGFFAFVCVTWLIQTCAIFHGSVMWEPSGAHILWPWVFYMCAATHSYVCRDSFIRVPRLIPWLIHMCTVIYLYAWHQHA